MEPAGARVIVAFDGAAVGESSTVAFDALAARERLSFGLLGATQGAYSVRQTLLDMTQGSRLSRSGYDPGTPPALALAGRRIAAWDAAVRRARSAPAPIVPGLLASSVPGGAAYVGTPSGSNVQAVVAADRRGRVAGVSLGAESDLARRARAMLVRHRLVVVNVPDSRVARGQLDRLVRRRDPAHALLVIATPPRSRAPQLLPVGAAGVGERAPGLLRSRTARRDGLVTGIDVLPTVLTHLRLPVPRTVHGRPITVVPGRDVAYVRALERRLRAVYPRRYPAAAWVLGALLFAAIAGNAVLGRRRTLRGCGLGLLWLPSVALLTAALEPSRHVELLIVGPGSIALGFLTDRLLAWPRAPALPGLVGAGAYVADLAFGSPLIVRSLLGPNPRFGARFYGIGNELEAVLPVLALVGIAGAAGAALRSRRLAAAFAATMLVLGAAVGAGRLGADVGGVITIGAGGAAATVASLPGGPSRRAVLLACAIPLLAVAALAAIDLLTGGDSHFSSTVLGADDPAALWDVVERRTTLAAQAFARGLMPLATLAAAAAVFAGIRRRRALLRGLEHHPAWAAALAGGVAAGIVGSLANDSGPVLLVLGTVGLGAAMLYLRGGAGADSEPKPAAEGGV